MSGGVRRTALAAVSGVLLSVVMATGTCGAAFATAPLVHPDTALNEGLIRYRPDRVPCDYTYTDKVVIDKACKGKCGFGRQYRVNRVVKMWPPGTPKTEKPIFHFTSEWLCTPTRALAGDKKSAPKKSLTCMAMFLPAFKELCMHMPKSPGCGWKVTPRLKKKVAKAIKATVPPPTKQSITQCRKKATI